MVKKKKIRCFIIDKIKLNILNFRAKTYGNIIATIHYKGTNHK
jgi:hypothetical protein